MGCTCHGQGEDEALRKWKNEWALVRLLEAGNRQRDLGQKGKTWDSQRESGRMEG